MATGFQIAFLLLALQFFAMLAASWGAARLAWLPHGTELLGQVVTFGIAIIVLAGVGPLRRFCAGELRRELPRGAAIELAAVSAAKAAIPFAVIGGTVLWAHAAGAPERLAAILAQADPARAREWSLSAPGFVRMLALSWIVGPVVEELVFRGLLYRAWERQWGWQVSLVLTSALFALCHPQFAVSSFLGSVVYICVLRRTGTLRASILVHAAYNVLVSWPLLGQFILTPPVAEAARLSAWVVPIACLAFVAAFLPAYLRMSRTDARGRG